MKIAFNPSTVAALTTPPNNKDITFDLRGRNIFARGVKFYGTDTNTWRDIKINNVSIGSHTLDLRNGSNTTLTNTNGVVTINSTWRPVVDNLTSDSTTSSLSAKQGKVLKALIDGKSNSDHNHDGRYVRYYAVTTLDCNNLAAGLTAARISATNAAHTNHSAYLYISDVGTPFQIQIPDSSIPYIYKRYYGSGKWSGWFKLNAGYADSAGSVAWANVTGKPSSYTPSAHTHAWNSLTHSSTTENQAILTNGKANGWKLQTLNIARWDNAANNAHSHANKSVLDGITSALVNSWNTAYNFVSNITGTDTDKVINKWEEIVNFLAGITEDNKLNTLLNSKLSIQQLSAKDILTTKTNNALFWVDTKGNASTITTGPFTDHPYALLSVTNYNQNAENHKFFYRSRLAFSSAGDIKVASCHHEYEYQQDETWYNVLTSKNSGINGSTIKLNGTSITVYSSGTADGRYVKKSGDTMSGVLTIDTPNFGALTIKRNDDANGASIQFRGKSSVYGYIGLNNSTKDKQFLRWSSDISRIYTILDTSSTYISNGKGVINGTTITQVDNATNSTNSTNARKLVNWYSARPTSLNAQFGDGSLRIFYATSSTTEGKPAEDSHILHLAWDNTGGYDAQLAVHTRSGKVSTRAQNGGTWQPWKTLAFTTDIPTSLKNPYSFNVFGVVYDGSAAKTVTTSNFISQVNEGTSTITDGTMLITSYASNSGFADTNAVNVPYKRKAIHLWEYIKAKTDSLYATKGHNHDDRYYTKAESNAKYITDITTSVNKLTFTRNGSNIIRDITVNVVHSQGYLTNIPNKDNTTKASSGLYIYNSYNQVIGTNSYSSVLSINTGGTIQIAGNWGDDHARNLYWRSQSDRNVADYPWKSWRTILDSENYSSTLDSRYYTESEVNSLLDAKLNRQNLSYGTWNPRGYHLAADYNYNGGDLSISESGGKIHVSVDGYFWQNEGQYRVLDTSDVAGLKSNLTVHQYLSATDAAWYPLVWGGNSHNNTSDSTGAVYKSYDKLSWQTSSQTLYATNIQTNNIKNLSIGGGIYWNPNVESASDGSDAASITLVRSGVAGGTTLVLSQMNDTNDTIQFKTNTAARLYHNSYPILTTQNTYVSNNKGYINGTEITQVNNSDKVDNRHAISTTPNTGIIYKAAIYTSYSLTSYWVRLASIPSIGQNGEFVATIHVQSGHSNPGRSAILLVYLRGNASSFMSKSFKICCNSNYDPNRFRLYYKDSDKTSEIWYQTTGQQDGIITTVISQSSEGHLYEGLTLYSGSITAVQTPSVSTYLSAQVSTITDNISGNASTATKLQTPRTIWGQSFDGTGNVSGSLSEVGNIHFKVDNSYDIGSDAAASRYIYTHWLGAKSGSKLELGANNSGYGKGLCIDTNLNVGIGTNTPAYKLDVKGDIYTTTGFKKNGSSDSYVLLGGGGHKAISDFAISTHTHGLLHSDLTVTLANTTTDSGWSMINSSYNGFLLKSIRTQGSAPNWIENNYAAGICFGGADTKGVVSVAYNRPYIKFAGGNGSKPVWWIRLSGISGATYNLANFNADTLDGVHLNGIFTGFSYAQSKLTATIGTVSKTVNVTGSYPSIGGVTMNTIASYGNCMGMANLASSNSNVNPNNQTSWHHFINMSYNTESTNMWQTQLAIKAGTTEVWVRSRAGGSISDSSAWAAPWVRLARITDNIASATNADMVDGYHENSFLRYRGATYTDQEATLWSQIGIKQYNNALPDNLTGVYNYGSVISFPGFNSRFEIYASHQSSNGNGLYYRSGWGSDKKTWLKFIDSSNIGSQSVNYANSAGHANSAGNANTLDGIDSTRFLRQVVVPNNTENDFNTFSNMTLTGRVDPTTGASLKNAPWSGSGPAGGYGVLTYLFNGSGYGTQMAWGYSDNRIYIRNRYWGGSGVGPVWRTSWDTLALTSDIPTVTNYYWANVKISASSSTTTSPTVSNLTATSSIRMSNISLEHTDEINNITNGGIHLNYRNSGNVSLCYGGGNVGIGTTTPSYKLDVNGQMRASGFHHASVNSDNYMLLAGGGYKTLKDFIFLNKSYNYTDNEHYNLTFHKLSGICNNLVWVDGHVKGSIAKFFVIDPAVFPYRYDEDPNLNTIYLMSGNNYITINAIGIVTINNATDHDQRVGFFYTGRA